MTRKDEVAAARVAVGHEEKAITALVVAATDLTITTPEQLEACGVLLIDIKGRRRDLEEHRMAITRLMDEAKRKVMEVFRPAEDRLLDAERDIKAAILAYTREQERLQREAQAKLDEAARRERERIQRLAERQREAGRGDRAVASEERVEEVEAPIVEAPSTLRGPVHVRTTWSAEVTDLLALVRACAAGKQSLDLLQPDVTRLNSLARAQKETFSVPGVKAVAERGVAARTNL